jgi:hypothetical protein
MKSVIAVMRILFVVSSMSSAQFKKGDGSYLSPVVWVQ